MSAEQGQDVGSEKGPAYKALLDRLAGHFGERIGATAVFGTPIQRDWVTIVPVAKASWGFGGGMGSGKNEEDAGEGAGGGGGARMVPLGFIEVKGDSAEFRPIYDPALLFPLVVAGGILFLLLFRRIHKLLK